MVGTISYYLAPPVHVEGRCRARALRPHQPRFSARTHHGVGCAPRASRLMHPKRWSTAASLIGLHRKMTDLYTLCTKDSRHEPRAITIHAGPKLFTAFIPGAAR